MDFDLRRPLGAMFLLLGLLLVGYGLLSDPDVYRRSFGINVNLIWGAVLLIFGGTMSWFGRGRRPPSGQPLSGQPLPGQHLPGQPLSGQRG